MLQTRTYREKARIAFRLFIAFSILFCVYFLLNNIGVNRLALGTLNPGLLEFFDTDFSIASDRCCSSMNLNSYDPLSWDVRIGFGVINCLDAV